MNIEIMKNFMFHHVGLIVRDMDAAILNYADLFGRENISEIFILESQKIKECFVKNGINSYLGLVSPIDNTSVIYGLMKKGITYYHVAYKVKSMDKVLIELEKLNYKVLSLFNSEAFEGGRCSFLYTPDGHLIELIEDENICEGAQNE